MGGLPAEMVNYLRPKPWTLYARALHLTSLPGVSFHLVPVNNIGHDPGVGQQVASPPSTHLGSREAVVVLGAEVTLQRDGVLA